MRRLLRAVTIPVLFAVVGFLVAHYGASTKRPAALPALSGQATGGGFALRYPAGWSARPAAAALHGALDGAVVISPDTTVTAAAGSSLAVGVAHPARPGTLSPGVRGLITSVPPPQVVALGGTHFLRYPGSAPRIGTGSDWVYLLPTTRGTVTAICAAPRMTGEIVGGCERMLGTLRLASGSVLSVGVDPGYALELNRILTTLDATRAAVGGGLRAADPRARAAAARTLSGADRRAAGQVAHLSGVAVSVANAGLVSALQRGARAYRDLAAASAAHDARRYAAAEGEAGRAERALDRAFRRLREQGYRIA